MSSTSRSPSAPGGSSRLIPRCGATSHANSGRRDGRSGDLNRTAGRCRAWDCAGRVSDVTETGTAEESGLNHLRLTARLNTSALDSRRGVVRLHPEAIAALSIREWDAVSLTGSRTTASVAGIAPPGTPVGTALLDDV